MSSQVNGIRYHANSLANAAILTLPTAAVTIAIPAPGTGFWIKLLSFTWITNFSAGAYTGMNTTYAALQVETVNGDWLASNLLNDSASSITDVSSFFGATAKVFPLVVPACFPDTANQGWIQYPLGTTVAHVNNAQIRISMDNNGSGNLGGGNAANTLKYRLAYQIEAL